MLVLSCRRVLLARHQTQNASQLTNVEALLEGEGAPVFSDELCECTSSNNKRVLVGGGVQDVLTLWNVARVGA